MGGDDFVTTFCLPQSIMLHWQPPPAGTHSGQITGYKIRYRKVSRKSDVTESIGGTQLFQLIEGELLFASIFYQKGGLGAFSGLRLRDVCVCVGFLPWKKR